MFLADHHLLPVNPVGNGKGISTSRIGTVGCAIVSKDSPAAGDQRILLQPPVPMIAVGLAQVSVTGLPALAEA